ncbi:MAG: N-acetyl-gamma-glutamyl-phosphate reductase [Actinomycetota bacterium]|jgi:N-acetyl-gamma-glutamyl-phosphate reductase|nr:N-acetyl-gamma-glutamyl-phosphate reductase [Actinomycetota bacterium]
MKVGIVGASGFTGAELLRLCAGHPSFDVHVATARSQAGREVAALYPSLAAVYGGTTLVEHTVDVLDGLDLVFLCLPHGQSQQMLPDLVDRVGLVVDLAADFRLVDPEQYRRWYGKPHSCPELLESFVYGLPELNRAKLEGATRIAAPGCYPTAASLALAPFVRSGLVQRSGIVVDAASGVSGAGRGLDERTQFTTADADFTAYGLLAHRHTPEIEQTIGAEILFTPHLAPMSRGILATCYARPVADGQTMTTTSALELLAGAYRDEPFVVVGESIPSTKATTGSNAAHLTARVDDRTGWLLVLCAIDNLVKGASGQAVQAANAAVGLPEATGLSAMGVYP